MWPKKYLICEYRYLKFSKCGYAVKQPVYRVSAYTEKKNMILPNKVFEKINRTKILKFSFWKKINFVEAEFSGFKNGLNSLKAV